MDKLIYIAMTGAKHMFHRQENIAHNLAHANTPGYKAETLAFRSVETAARARVYAIESSTGADLRAGPIQQTGRALDVAPEGEAWFALQAGGGEAYTRAGNLQVGADGVLRGAGGMEVIGDGGAITVPPNAEVTIARDGTVSAVQPGRARTPVALGRIKLVTPPPDGLARGADGLFRARDGAALARDERAALASGALEGSNVNPVEAMVGMISAARQFEMQMKMLQTAEADARAATQLLSAGGG